MCLAIPARVIEMSVDGYGVVEVGGVRRAVGLMMVDDVHPGDFVIVHVGFAIAKLDEEEARKTLALFAEIAGEIGEGTLADSLLAASQAKD